MSSLSSLSIQQIDQERPWVKDDVYELRVNIVGETRGAQHAEEVKKALEKKYSSLHWN